MKTPTQIESKIHQLQQQLQKARQREREQRLARLLSALGKSHLTDDEAVAAIEAAGLVKKEGRAHG